MELHYLLSTLNGHLNRDEVVPTDLQANLVELGIDVETYVENYEPDYLGDQEWTTTLEDMTTEMSKGLSLPLALA